jgi:hypothetical protein
VWVKKRAQFLERAAPTEALVTLARTTREPIHIHCFPYNFHIARLAVEMSVQQPPELVWESNGDEFSRTCLAVRSFPVASVTPMAGGASRQ